MDEHMKDAAQEDMGQDVAEDVPGAAENGSTKVLVVARAIFQRRDPRLAYARRPPCCPWRHVNDLAQAVVQDVAEDVTGAAENGSAKVLVVARAIFQRRDLRVAYARRHPCCPWVTREGRARE